MPLPAGGITITVQRSQRNEWDDVTYTDSHQIRGCMDYPTGSSGNRTGSGEANGVGGGEVLTEARTLLLPPGSDVRHTDRILIHPPGVAVVPAGDTAIRQANVYQVVARPVDWRNWLTGWSPGMQVDLERVS